jgi:hypothetical protein
MPQPYKPSKRKGEEIVKEVGRKEEEALLLKTTLTSDILTINAEERFPQVLNLLPVTLHVKTKYRGIDMMRKEMEELARYGFWAGLGSEIPWLALSAVLEGREEAVVLYDKRVKSDSEASDDVFLPSSIDGRRLTNFYILWSNNIKNTASLDLEILYTKK